MGGLGKALEHEERKALEEQEETREKKNLNLNAKKYFT